MVLLFIGKHGVAYPEPNVRRQLLNSAAPYALLILRVKIRTHIHFSIDPKSKVRYYLLCDMISRGGRNIHLVVPSMVWTVLREK